MFDVPYGITKRIKSASVAAVRGRVQEALASEGFGILTEIDLQATLEKKLGVHRAPYLILGACNPKLAHQAIGAEPAIGLLLPCNVVVAQDGDDVVVSAAAPKAMFSIVEGAPKDVVDVAVEADARLRRAIEKI